MFTNTVLAATQFRAYVALRGTTEDQATERARAACDWAQGARAYDHAYDAGSATSTCILLVL